MKQVIVLLLFSNTLSPLSGEAGISLGVLGIGFNAGTEYFTGYYYGRLLNFIYQSENGLGIRASPLFFSSNIAKDSDFKLSFINISFFYNTFKNIHKNIILGPFVSIEAVNHETPQFAEFHAGLTFSLRNLDGYYSDNNILDTDVLFAELGYKYNHQGKHEFYTQAGLDLLTAIWYLGYDKQKSLADYQRDRHPNY